MLNITGPVDANTWIVCAKSSASDLALGEPFTGAVGRYLASACLRPLKCCRCDAALVAIDGDQATVNSLIRQAKPTTVIAVGKGASFALGALATITIPHPEAILRKYDSGEVARKIKGLTTKPKSDTSKCPASLNPGAPGESIAEGVTALIIKADKAKQIVYGAVLDPNIIDGDGDWTSPSEVEKTAHNFLTDSRMIGYMHEAIDDSSVVESWVEQYPSDEDYRLAMRNKPHRIYSKKFGDDRILSGTWMMGVRLGNESWKRYKSGELNGFSPGGTGVRLFGAADEKPEVEVIDVG